MLLVLERRGLSLPQLALQLVVQHRPVDEAEHHSQQHEGLENPLLLSGAHPVAHVPGGVPAPPPLTAQRREAAGGGDEAETSAAPGPRRGWRGGGERPAERLSPGAPPRRPGRPRAACGPRASRRSRPACCAARAAGGSGPRRCGCGARGGSLLASGGPSGPVRPRRHLRGTKETSPAPHLRVTSAPPQLPAAGSPKEVPLRARPHWARPRGSPLPSERQRRSALGARGVRPAPPGAPLPSARPSPHGAARAGGGGEVREDERAHFSALLAAPTSSGPPRGWRCAALSGLGLSLLQESSSGRLLSAWHGCVVQCKVRQTWRRLPLTSVIAELAILEFSMLLHLLQIK